MSCGRDLVSRSMARPCERGRCHLLTSGGVSGSGRCLLPILGCFKAPPYDILDHVAGVWPVSGL